ncbi:TOG domain [Sesbania bispinosa]|nr:TOG domain [Sesbania bispinosa]
MAKEGPNWDGLLKWSIAHSDGTRPTRNLSEDDRRWFMEAMQAQTMDVVKRMKEITLVMQTPQQVLEDQGVTPADIEELLDELQEHVESIDMANVPVIFDDWLVSGSVFFLIGELLSHLFPGIYPFPRSPLNWWVGSSSWLPQNSHANIRAKAAEVVTTIVQNNPRSQQLVMEANGFEPLVSNFSSDPDVNVRTKSLGAISSLIRHNKPGITAFRLANGYAGLKDALTSENVRFQRKALNLIHYLLHENSSDCNIVNELGFPRILMHLASSEDADVREAALRGLLELARDTKDGYAEDNEKMKQLLEERINGISLMSAEDLGAAKEERQLVDSLWSTCFNEPSSLREKGLLVLPGEDAAPPDVASKHFEPPLRSWSRNPSSNNEKKETPLLLGAGPSSADTTNQVNTSSEGSASSQTDTSR